MAKMFWTAEEAAEHLGISVPEVLEMGNIGELQEFRDGKRPMYKIEEVKLRAGSREPTARISGDEAGRILNLTDAAIRCLVEGGLLREVGPDLFERAEVNGLIRKSSLLH